jgi:RHS repeat-associated protein
MAMVSATGTVQNSYAYDVYGQPTVTGSLPNEFDFAGQQTDGTGLQYLRARYMDPETGTFLSREPLAARPEWTGTPTGYAVGNPARLTDPTGLRPLDGTEDSQSCRGSWCYLADLAEDPYGFGRRAYQVGADGSIAFGTCWYSHKKTRNPLTGEYDPQTSCNADDPSISPFPFNGLDAILETFTKLFSEDFRKSCAADWAFCAETLGTRFLPALLATAGSTLACTSGVGTLACVAALVTSRGVTYASFEATDDAVDSIIARGKQEN